MKERTRPWKLPATLLACHALLASAPTGPCEEGLERSSQPLAEGLVLHEEACLEPLYHAYTVQMQLAAPGYRFLVTPWKDRLSTKSEFAALHGALVAVNGGFWGSSWGGLTVSDGKPWPGDPAGDERQVPNHLGILGAGGEDMSGSLARLFLPPSLLARHLAPAVRG